MTVKIFFSGALKRLAACDATQVDLQPTESLETIVQKVAATTNSDLRDALMDESGCVRPSVLLFQDQEMVLRGLSLNINATSEIWLTTLISGG